ncbi:DNA topoisomerase (ATP-hydrolyzing) subunit B [Patulibacter minatonensis]|uniref:DNA topoisomerase (ATP-hydrolyzing) subunit B n=1 Tax=Patulibacter minatonensis TaxID=298163 RepID=UPI00146FC1CA|nr:DNA topoisomerase (ATP-hydrolyzing) subunit B [Patulibacter minatonensis]
MTTDENPTPDEPAKEIDVDAGAGEAGTGAGDAASMLEAAKEAARAKNAEATKAAKARTATDATYDAADITVLEGLEAVRHRPGMYIGSTGVRGLHHLVWEIVDNSVDEALAGHASTVTIVVHPDNSVTVSDDGRGIPVAMHETGKSTVEVVLTVLHAGGKFGDGGGYKVSGGLHGVGSSVVNALSEEFDVTIRRDGFVWTQSYVRGVPTADLAQGEALPEGAQTGTTIRFLPDTEIFDTTEYDWSTLESRLRETAFLTRGLRIVIEDEREGGKRVDFHYEGGIADFVEYLNESKDPIGKKVIAFDSEDEKEGAAVEIAMQWNSTYTESVHSFANNINTHEGGSHLSGFRSALTRTINAWARANNELKEKDVNLSGEDVREGLTAVISAKLTNPQFEGQTKTKLGNPGIEGFVQKVVNEKLQEFFEENKAEAVAIVRKAVQASQARSAARKARDLTRRKSALENSRLPGKLADCSVKDPSLAELFIVEGNSAGGSAKQGRDRHTQAILPLRGKILNVERARIDKVLQNTEVQSLITAIGTGIREEFDISAARYHKIILMTDADVDGAHIRTLALTLIFREMQELIEAGFVYIAKPPLYKVRQGGNDRYIEKEAELEEYLLSDKLEKFEVVNAAGDKVPLNDAKWKKFARLRKQHEGWASALRAEHGMDTVHFLASTGLVHDGITGSDNVLVRLQSAEVSGIDAAIDVKLLSEEGTHLRIRTTEKKTGLARTTDLDRTLFDSPEYVGFVKVHQQLVGLFGQPSFTIKLGERTEDADTFEELGRGVLSVAQKGVALSRFKGLGEMNAEQLRETTMDPAHRTLQQVTVDDAAGADRLFSMLMGEHVEHRRNFIEEHGRQVANLDV